MWIFRAETLAILLPLLPPLAIAVNISMDFCTRPSAQRTLEYFAPRYGAPPPATYDPATSKITVQYPGMTTAAYYYEGARYADGVCTECQYTEPPVDNGGVRAVNAPMYGPCLDGQRSIKVACVQNMMLYPIEFVGEYYYPEQRLTLNGTKLFSHAWLQDLNFRAFGNPSEYGLGRAAVIANLHTLHAFNATSGDEDARLTEQLRAPYEGDGWLKWAQHFCTNGCHRDARYQHVVVREDDYKNKSPTLAYLNRGPNTTVVRCLKCPPYQSAYRWEVLKAGDPATSVIGSECFPWFGSVPVLVTASAGNSGAKILNKTHNISHSGATDGVVYPNTSTYYQAIPCPVGTYNDKCAHSFLFSANATCKPCPPGWHTGGMIGAWFCLPPLGDTILLNPIQGNPINSAMRTILNMHRDPATNMSLLWARRDILGYDFECGSKPSDCKQCGKFDMRNGALPHDFNREYILDKILVWQSCPSGYYCPAALDTPIRCPAATPWSPTGSHSIANCSCGRGYYYSTPAACVACPDRMTTCPMGRFLSGWKRCAEMDGAVSGGTCEPCDNLPARATYGNQSGVEVLLYTPGRIRGMCPFVCEAGTQLLGSLPDYQCLPLVKNGRYSPELTSLRDSLFVTPYVGGTLTLSNAASDLSLPSVSTSCAQATGMCETTACVVSHNSTYDSDYECVACGAAPAGAEYMYGDAIETSYTCEVRCLGTAQYFNKTLRACVSCAALDATHCAPNGRVAGGGCYGNFSSSLTCVNCNLPLPDPNSRRWLSLDTCVYKQCSSQPPTTGYYIQSDCGGISDAVVRPCTSACPALSYLSGTCQTRSTGRCVACTVYSLGNYMIGNCTSTADSVWTQCLAGYYCIGYGPKNRCPGNQTSDPGAMSDTNCYCPVGFKAEGPQCVPFRCTSAPEPVNRRPGASYVSKYYMKHDAQRITVCVQCPATSLSILDGGVGVQSCVCSGTEVYNNGSACLPCAATGCASCWRGGVCSRAAAAAQCPPFVASCNGAIACDAGFVYAAARSTAAAEQGVTGSSLYIPKPAVWRVWRASETDQVKHLTSTSDQPQNWDRTNLQFVLWTQSLYPGAVWAHSASRAPDDLLNSAWRISPSTVIHIEAIAAAPWPLSQTMARLFPTGSGERVSSPTTVAAVVRRGSDGVLLIYKNQLSVAPEGGANWGSGLSFATLNSNSSAMDVVAFGFGGTTLFLAYNGLVSSGVAMIPSGGTPQYIEFRARRMNAAAFMPTSGNDVQIYAVFDTSPQQVRAMKWSSHTSEVEELFIPPPFSIKKLLVSQTSTASVVFIAHAAQMLVADNAQRTFTPIQGMPLGTRPDLIGPLTAEGALLASSGGSIFLLDTMQCAGYWDGASCQQHVCVRARPCAANEEWARSMCVCKAGYTKSNGGCNQCPIGFYCNSGNKTRCSDSKTTYEPGASDASECICTDGQYLNGNKCEACRVGYFCPNRVNILPCPGKALQTTSAGSNSPKGCECDAGGEGPACEPCVGTKYCPRSTRVAVNYALTATLGQQVLGQQVCSTLGDVVRDYISVDKSAKARVWCQYYAEASVVAIMIQSDTSSSTFRDMPNVLKRNSTLARINASFILDRFNPPGAAGESTVKVTEPTQCPEGQKPSADYTRCVCGAGYSSNDGGVVQTYCTACRENFFSADGVACVACPHGSAKAAATCVASSAHRLAKPRLGMLLLLVLACGGMAQPKK